MDRKSGISGERARFIAPISADPGLGPASLRFLATHSRHTRIWVSKNSILHALRQFMFKVLFHRVRLFDYKRLLSGWWRDLAFYWHTRNKGNLLFFSVLTLPVIALGFVIYSSIAEKNRNQDLVCLALNVYHEARGEPMVGQYAVAEVTMNRVASKRYPDTVCEVVYEKRWDRIRRRDVGAFSWTELESLSKSERAAWRRAWEAAEAVYDKRQAPTLQGALFYHARNIKPSWARGKKPVARIGKHIFYK